MREAPVPEPGDLEILVHLTKTGICGTDIALASGKLGVTSDILGHEGVGRVVKIGRAVLSDQARIGQRVGVGWIRDACGACQVCLREGGETRCLAQAYSGWRVEGTLAQYTIVPARYVTVIPEGIPDELCAPIMCAGVTIYKALKISGAVPGDMVVLSGGGGAIGLLGIQYARAMGLRVVALDGGKVKEKICLDVGAEVYIDFENPYMGAGEKSLEEELTEKTAGRKAAAVIVCAGSTAAYEGAFSLLEPFGTMVCVGVLPPTQSVRFCPTPLIDNGFRIVGSLVGTRKDVQEAIAFVGRGLVKPRICVIRLQDLNSAVEKVQRGEATEKIVVDLSGNDAT